MNLRLLPENLNLLTQTSREQESRARAGCCSLPQVNQAFVGLQHQSQVNIKYQTRFWSVPFQCQMRKEIIIDLCCDLRTVLLPAVSLVHRIVRHANMLCSYDCSDKDCAKCMIVHIAARI